MSADELPTPLSEIPRTPVDRGEIEAYQRESQHFRVAFDLVRELTQWAVILGSAYAGRIRPWNVREAIVAGHLLRIGKLLRGLLAECKDRRPEIAWILLRAIGEAAINLRFLLAHADESVIKSYVLQSLQYDRDLRDEILRNVAERDGSSLPIEDRMLRSIDRTFRDSQIDYADVPLRRIQNWANLTLRQRAERLGIERAYFAVIGGPSRHVHGGWKDLVQHHLKVVAPGQFEPKFEDLSFRPQPLYALCPLILPAFTQYVEQLEVADGPRFDSRLKELAARFASANELHEGFLVRRSESSRGAV